METIGGPCDRCDGVGVVTEFTDFDTRLNVPQLNAVDTIIAPSCENAIDVT